MDDYENCRDSERCPVCGRDKDRGLLACWACFKRYDMRNGLTNAIRRLLEQAEAR